MKEKKEEKGSEGGEKKYQPSNGFKIVLSAILSDEDFKMLEAHIAMHVLTLVLSLAAFMFWLTFKMLEARVAAGAWTDRQAQREDMEDGQTGGNVDVDQHFKLVESKIS
eukprot:6049701-Ditylum_brightwellii.AAC.1